MFTILTGSYLTVVLEDSFTDTVNGQKDRQVDQIKPELYLEAKMTKLRLLHLSHIRRRK